MVNKFQDILGSTYDIFSNRSIMPFLSYRPTDEAVQKAVTLFRDETRQNGKPIIRTTSRVICK